MELPNGLYTEYNYDALNRLVDVNNYSSSAKSTTLSSFIYTLAENGMRSKVTEVEQYGNTTVIDWSYDKLNRLVREDYDDQSVSDDDYIHDYVYDLVGNRVSKDDGNDVTYSFYNINDHLQKESLNSDGSNPTIQYGYNNNGSLTSKAVTGSDTTTYGYNLQNRLASVIAGSNAEVTYEYNPQGIRVQKVIDPSGPNELTYEYLIDSYNRTGYAQVFEEDDGSDRKVYIIGSDVLGHDLQGTQFYYLRDGHGSTRQLTYLTYPLQSYKYDAYGNMLNPPAQLLTNVLYVSQMLDPASGFYYNSARWYAPPTGRFNRSDDYPGNNQDPQSLHKYLYCSNNPVNGVDPSGLYTLTNVIATSAIRSVLNEVDLGIYDAVETSIRASLNGSSLNRTAATMLAWNIAPYLIGPGIEFISYFVDDLFSGLIRRVGSRNITVTNRNLFGCVDELSDLYNMSGRNKDATEFVGIVGGGFTAKKLGYLPSGFKPKYHGIDDIWVRGNEYLIIEYKGGAGRLSMTTAGYEQMSQDWILNRLKKAKESNSGLIKKVQRAIGEGRVQCMVVKTPVKGGNAFVPSHEIKHFSHVGRTRW